MKLKNILCLGLLTFVLFGCGDSPEIIKYKTEKSLKSPEVIGTLPDGRVIQRIWIQTGRYPHVVYFFMNGGKEVTVNQSVQEGKVTYNQVVVLLDGIPVSTNIINK